MHGESQQLLHNFDIVSFIERANHQHAFEYFSDVQHTSLMLYRTMQPEYKPAQYLSVVTCASKRRLTSRFRTGCLGQRVRTGRWADGLYPDRTDWLVCASHWIVWRLSSTLILIAQRTLFGQSIWTFCSTVVLMQTGCLCVNETHVMVSLGMLFLSGMYPMTNSRNCTCQQSSVNCRDQCVRMIESMQSMSANMHEFRMHVGSIALQLWLAEC